MTLNVLGTYTHKQGGSAPYQIKDMSAQKHSEALGSTQRQPRVL